MEHVLVTGAAGFLGRAVVEELIRSNYRVRALVRSEESVRYLSWNSKVDIFEADLRSSINLERAFEQIDAVIHAAACKKGAEQEQYESTVSGTERLLDAMAKSKAKRLIFISTLSVYDFDKMDGELTEDSPLESKGSTRDGYAASKIAQERVVREKSARHGWDLTVLRPGMLWGSPKEYPHVLSVPLGKVHLVIGPSKDPNLVQVNHCAEAILEALQNRASIGRTFNLVEQNGMNAWAFVGHYLKGTQRGGWRIPIPYQLSYSFVQLVHYLAGWMFSFPSLLIPSRFQARFKPYTCPGSSAKRILNWNPRSNIEDFKKLCGDTTDEK